MKTIFFLLLTLPLFGQSSAFQYIEMMPIRGVQANTATSPTAASLIDTAYIVRGRRYKTHAEALQFAERVWAVMEIRNGFVQDNSAGFFNGEGYYLVEPVTMFQTLKQVRQFLMVNTIQRPVPNLTNADLQGKNQLQRFNLVRDFAIALVQHIQPLRQQRNVKPLLNVVQQLRSVEIYSAPGVREFRLWGSPYRKNNPDQRNEFLKGTI